jgi:hypothetical protein
LAHIFIGCLLTVMTVDYMARQMPAGNGPGSDQVSSPEKSAKRCPGRALPDDGVESETGSLHKKFYAMRINRFKMLRRKRATTSLAARAACFAAAAAM